MNYLLNNKVDRYFMPTEIHKEMAKVTMGNHAKNVHVVGAPKLDIFFDKSYQPKDVWKPQNGKKKKRIIWAPHHSDNFPGNLYQFNAFYEIADFMFEMAEKYKDDIQIAFKPHPMLFPYLVNKKWDKETAEYYYDCWANLENGQLETGDFIDLFLTSDAMILDSISFIAEYTATNKPSLFTVGPTSRVKLNKFGMMNYDVLYHTRGDQLKADIEKFIVDVVINGNDTKKVERTAFVNKHLLPPNGKTAADNIFDNIIDEIQNGDKK
jgi:CDP-glycerol glycerophosphotransferase (TagB/SpsB family)